MSVFPLQQQLQLCAFARHMTKKLTPGGKLCAGGGGASACLREQSMHETIERPIVAVFVEQESNYLTSERQLWTSVPSNAYMLG
eukprot:6474909-Amphidinium_carterae.1